MVWYGSSVMQNKSSHFQVFEGDLYDTRKATIAPIRAKYSYSFREIKNLSQVKATIRNGPFAWPSGYPLFLLTHDGAALCFKCAEKEFRQIAWDFLRKASTGWQIVGCEINYEEPDLACAHCSKSIDPAYGKD